MTVLQQDALDYSNEAQYRICADTRVLRKKRTLTLIAGVQTYRLAEDVLVVLAVLHGQDVPLPFLTPDEAMKALTNPSTFGALSYYTIGEDIGFVPVPAEAATLTLYYEARPAPLTSDSAFELQGDYELLIDRLVQAMKLADDGQPELAAEEQSYYDLELIRLRRRDAREARNRISLLGFDG
jgi:hypothetical protein